MTLEAGTLLRKLRELEAVAGTPSRYVIAFSGGLDSTVLLHVLVTLLDELAAPLLAIHVNHGLHAESDAWSKHCRDTAGRFGVDYQSLAVKVQLESGKGPEASARDARYNALHAELRAGDWLMSAHHREDQAETLLLNLIRGSGPMGVAGIGSIRRFGPGWLARPLLETGREELVAYASREELAWVEDPSNADRRFDRNFLRHDILPRLGARWPDISVRLQRSASHAGEASQLLTDLATIDLEFVGGRAEKLAIDRLLQLSPARQRNVLRHAIRQLGLATPTAMQLARIQSEVIPARADAQPLVTWSGAAVRRYRNSVYLLPQTLQALPECIDVASEDLPGAAVTLGPGHGVLRFIAEGTPGLSKKIIRRGVQIRFRQGGEEFQPLGQSHTRKLKKLLQEEGVVPWMRERLPLVFAGDDLVAVGDLWLAAQAVAEPGIAVSWQDRPALH